MFALKLIAFLIVLGFAGLMVARRGIGPAPGYQPRRPALWIMSILSLVVLAFALQGVGAVPAGHRGVVLRFGAVTGTVLGEGIYFITPFIESVEEMDVQVHAHRTPAAAASHDLQEVKTEITLNFRLDPASVDTVYRDLRQDYEARIITPAVQEAIKASTAEYDAEQLIQHRVKVRNEIEQALVKRLAVHGILVDAVSITDFQFSPDFEKAIESKVVATQAALRAENDLRRIETEAKQRVATAEGEAKAIAIQAEAITSKGGEQYVNLKAIEKWDGRLPQWMASGAPVPFVNVAPAK